MYNMTFDLYTVFADHNYAGLITIKTPQDIRIHGYKYNNGYLFQYRIAKTNPTQRMLDITLDSIRCNMLTDILTTHQDLGYQYTYYEIAQLYPFLYHGFYIMDVQDLGGTDVVLTISTNVQP